MSSILKPVFLGAGGATAGAGRDAAMDKDLLDVLPDGDRILDDEPEICDGIEMIGGRRGGLCSCEDCEEPEEAGEGASAVATDCGCVEIAGERSASCVGSGDNIGGSNKSSGGFISCCCLWSRLWPKWWELIRFLPNMGCGSPSSPIGRFRNGIELKKLGPGSNRPLVIVDDILLILPILWCKSRRTCNIGTNTSGFCCNCWSCWDGGKNNPWWIER